MKTTRPSLMIILCICLFGHLSLLADNFTDALKAYEQGNFVDAREQFQEGVDDAETAALRHNLALTHFQSGQKAEAAWQLERAIRIEPFRDDYRFKIEALREHLGLIPLRPSWYELSSEVLTQTQWALLGCLGLWAVIISIILPRAAGHRPGLAIKAAQYAGIIALLASVPAFLLQQHMNQIGIVVNDETVTLHAAPAGASPETGTARPGERAHITDQHGDYFRVETEGQASGWISSDSFRPVIHVETDA